MELDHTQIKYWIIWTWINNLIQKQMLQFTSYDMQKQNRYQWLLACV